jgi:hypothetical protein
MTIKGRLFPTLPLLVFLVVGCTETSTPSKLSGTVKYRGNPVTAGTISLTAKEGGVYTIAINSDGTYAGADLPAGELAVAIETETANPKNRRSPDQYGGTRGKGQTSSPAPGNTPGAENASAAGAYVKIPSKYAKKETSGLSVTVNKGANTKDFELKDD